MKTPEDEAFDELARKQGAWGGGFPAKRAMAADKLQDGKCKLCVDGCAACDARAQPAQPAQEPVAWTLLLTGEHHGIIGEAGEKFIGAPECYQRVNVYTTPPKREWVGLTDEEINDCIKFPNRNLFARDGTTSQRIARAIEAKLKEKNT